MILFTLLVSQLLFMVRVVLLVIVQRSFDILAFIHIRPDLLSLRRLYHSMLSSMKLNLAPWIFDGTTLRWIHQLQASCQLVFNRGIAAAHPL